MKILSGRSNRISVSMRTSVLRARWRRVTVPEIDFAAEYLASIFSMILEALSAGACGSCGDTAKTPIAINAVNNSFLPLLPRHIRDAFLRVRGSRGEKE